MKLAIPTRGALVDDHFGHCDMYTVYTIENNQITGTEIIPSPQGCGCKSDIASILQANGVSLMLAGNMGNGALQKLNAWGIEVIRGCAGPVSQVVDLYLKGTLEDSGLGCAQHEHHSDDHQCNHHHH